MNQNLLKQDFPPQALSADTSRGFALTSIKAQYVIDRLNEVFGLYGTGWRLAHSPIIEVSTGELVTEVALQYRTEEGTCGAFMYSNGWIQLGTDKEWSQPVFAYGGKKPSQKGMTTYVDAAKSALTDALTKAASMLGVGDSVFKGLIDPTQKQPPQKIVINRPPSAGQPDIKQAESRVPENVGATEFYKEQKKKFGSDVPEAAKALATKAANGNITWAEALTMLGKM